MRTSPELTAFVHELAEQGADRWSLRVRWRTGFNATHVEALSGPGEDGRIEGVTYASGYYARFREHGTRYNAAEHVMRDFIRDIEG
ncbi:hypothetical protein IU449_27255 [Nocardia higoensis]|uniref:Uncharacterized protein n=1 Tax=Nocardia higoensis TaxID=228599 RepID=A0ABS0DMD8_9NOCA|nr:hypothetical protein [Nocardia higoensis]MBF6358199.1 hypothetical protein [Nocardia higoensis]